MALTISGLVSPRNAKSIPNRKMESDGWRSSNTLVVRKATQDELAVFKRLESGNKQVG